MRAGKLQESIFKRSVLKQLNYKRDEVLLGAGVANNCAAFEVQLDETTVMSTETTTGNLAGDTVDLGRNAVIFTLNDLASAGAQPIGVMISALLPETMEETDLKKLVFQIEETAKEFKIQIMGIDTTVTTLVETPILTVSGTGKVKNGTLISTSGASEMEDVVMTKWVGLEGTVALVNEKEAQLSEKLPQTLLDTAKSFRKYLSIQTEAATAGKSGVSAMYSVKEGGIFGALWKLAESSGVGLEIDLKKIPIRQETIEICEFFALNPYELISSGSLLITTKNGYGIVRDLEKVGIFATVIGKTMPGNDRILYNEEEQRYLEPAKQDEIYKIRDK